MATPVGAHIRESLEAMWYTVIQFLFVRVCLSIRLADALCDNLRETLLMTCVFAIFALHPRRIFEEFTT